MSQEQSEQAGGEELSGQDALFNTVVEGTYLRQEEDGYIFGFADGLEARLRLEEFEQAPAEGETVEMLVQRPFGDYWVASMQMLEKLKIWDWVKAKLESGEPIDGEVVRANKGGFSVDIGLRAFLPRSQVDLHPIDKPDPYLGLKDQFQILEFDEEKCEIVVSRRKLLEERQKVERADLLAALEPGQEFDGVVRNVKQYGAFVDIGGGVQGLLHESNMSWSRIDNVREFVSPGDTIRVVVLDWDPGRERLGLGRKQLERDPWEGVDARYEEGQIVEGEVVNMRDFGAFVQIEPGLEGLVHVSELSWVSRVNHPREVLSPGQQVQVKITSIDMENRRLGLSLKQIERNPWEVVAETLPPGTRLKEATIRNIVDFGLFVEIVPGIEGLVHVTDISWTDRVEDPSELYEVGQAIAVMVIDVDVEGERVKLGIKQLEQNPWETIEEIARPGKFVEGPVTKVTDFGAFVEIIEGVEGLIHISELAEDRVHNVTDVVRIGQQVKPLVLSVDRANERISLSLWKQELPGEAIKSYDESDAASTTFGDTFGDVLMAKLSEQEEEAASMVVQGSDEEE